MSTKAQRFAERLRNHNITPSEHVENIARFEQAGKLGRWLIRRREPDVYEQYQQELRRRDFRESQASIVRARQFPDPDPSEVVIY